MTPGRVRDTTDRICRFTLEPPRPYSLALTASRFTRFPEAVDRFDGESYRRLLPVGRRGVLMTVRQIGTPAKAILSITLLGPGARSPATRELAERALLRSLGVASEVGHFYRLVREDPWLASPIRLFRGLRIAGYPSLWEALVTAVLSQQVNLAFAYAIRQELVRAFGLRRRFDGKTYLAFPTAERLARESRRSLRAFRLSRAKASTLLRLAQAFSSGELREADLASLPDAPVIERLISIKGVGLWTAEIALLRGLGRVDVFPAGDLGIVKYLAQGLLNWTVRASEAQMRVFAERWRPYRGLALAYAYAELQRRRTADTVSSGRREREKPVR